MRERGILFRGSMVRAILKRLKRQTRRPVKRYEIRGPRPDGLFDWYLRGKWVGAHRGDGWHPDRVVGGVRETTDNAIRLCPYGVPGDRLWVRETFVDGTFNGGERRWIRFQATDAAEVPPETKWKPGIHLFRVDARILLDVERVRVQRLQDITEEDARAEGMTEMGLIERGHRYAFEVLWREIHGAASWDENPWLWVIEFKPTAR